MNDTVTVKTPIFPLHRRLVTAVLAIFGMLAILFGGLLGMMTLREFRPAEVQDAILLSEGEPERMIAEHKTYSLLTFNIGYAGLGAESDYVMAGGEQTRPESAAVVEKNLTGIRHAVSALSPEFVFLQEVDAASKRSYLISETELLADDFDGDAAFAQNYVCDFVPFPFPDMLGKVDSGIVSLADYVPTERSRISLPVPFSWPVRTCNLKRCLLVTRFPIQGSERELVLVNLQLEAYDDGEGKRSQAAQLGRFLTLEYEKGNYVVAGGDFNQTLPGVDTTRYPQLDASGWTAQQFEAEDVEGIFTCAVDDLTPTCRLLNRPYDAMDETTQYYVIDGFLCSPNVTVESVRTIDLAFEYADHNPVLLTFHLGK